eukprot:g689.t1
MPKVLLLCTSTAKLGEEETGAWHEEFAGPYYVFADAGCDVTISSTAGGMVPIDAASVGQLTKNDARFKGDPAASAKLAESVALSSLDEAALAEFDAIFLAGGHGTCVDFPDGAAAVVSTFARADKVVGAVCHGPMGLTKATLADGTPLVKGKRVCAFTDEEEQAVFGMRAGVKSAFDAGIAFSLESRLRELGADFAGGAAWSETAVADGKLVTGQNPMSSVKAAQLCLFLMNPVTVVYHKGFTGRGEAPMLLLEDAGVPYTMMRDMRAFKEQNKAAGRFPCFAAPALVHGDVAMSQTTAIMYYLGNALGYAPSGAVDAVHCLQIAENAADVWAESYTKPVDEFTACTGRCPNGRHMSWFSELEANLKASANGGNTYFGGGAEPTYADFAVLNAIRTVQFMMEAQAADALKSCPLLSAWMARIVARPRIASYLSSCEPVLYPSKKG